MMSDSFIYSGDDTSDDVRAAALEGAARKHSGISSESEAGLSVGTSMALAPECGLTFPQKCTC